MSESKYDVVKFKNDEFELDVNVDPNNETIWLTQEEISQLFEKGRSTITEHISNIYLCKELDEFSTCRFFRQVRMEGERQINRNVKMYNLDVIILVGYRVNSIKAQEFRKWANQVLKQYLLKGYIINENRVVVSNENYIELKNEVVNINNRLTIVEDKILDKQLKLDKILFNGQFYDAYTLVQSIFEKASSEIIIIDNYINRTILDRLVVKKSNVKVVIYTDIRSSRITNQDVNTFNKQYGNLIVTNTFKVHDRYIVIDRNKLYHLGASIKDLGNKAFSISESNNKLISELLRNI